MRFLTGILVLIIGVIFFTAVLPAMKTMTKTPRQCNYFNCDGFVDTPVSTTENPNCTATNRSYNSGLEEDELGCSILDIFLPLLILAVLVVAIIWFMEGRSTQETPPMYAGYGAGY
jgi:hypothetical protein